MSRETAEARQENGVQRWYRETRAELSKVTWPTRAEWLRLTLIVIVVTIISALVIFAVDSLFSFVIGLIIGAG